MSRQDPRRPHAGIVAGRTRGHQAAFVLGDRLSGWRLSARHLRTSATQAHRSRKPSPGCPIQDRSQRQVSDPAPPANGRPPIPCPPSGRHPGTLTIRAADCVALTLATHPWPLILTVHTPNAPGARLRSADEAHPWPPGHSPVDPPQAALNWGHHRSGPGTAALAGRRTLSPIEIPELASSGLGAAALGYTPNVCHLPCPRSRPGPPPQGPGGARDGPPSRAV